MRCFEITLNGERLAVAGALNTDYLHGFLKLVDPQTKSSSFRFSGLIPVAEDRVERGVWAEGGLKIGDELLVRIVESDTPDAWTIQAIEGTGVPKDDSRLSCSFCGKLRGDVTHLLAAGHVCICDECVALCVETLDEKSGGSP